MFELFFEALVSLNRTAHQVPMFNSGMSTLRVRLWAEWQSPRPLVRHLSTRIHYKSDFEGWLIALYLTGGEVCDCPLFKLLPDFGPDVRPHAMLADKGYDAEANREIAPPRVIARSMLFKSTAKEQSVCFSKPLHARRAHSEQCFGRLKHFGAAVPALRKHRARLRRHRSARFSLTNIKSIHTPSGSTATDETHLSPLDQSTSAIKASREF